MTKYDDGNGRIDQSEFHQFMEDSILESRKRERRSKVLYLVVGGLPPANALSS